MPNSRENADGSLSPVVGALIVDEDGAALSGPMFELSGDVVLDTFGSLTDSAENDPDAVSATIASLLRGILAELQAQTALLTEIEANQP